MHVSQLISQHHISATNSTLIRSYGTCRDVHDEFGLIRVFPCQMCLCQVTWTPDTDRGRVRGLQQTTNEKLSVEEIRQRGITSLTLHYSKASHKDIQ